MWFAGTVGAAPGRPVVGVDGSNGGRSAGVRRDLDEERRTVDDELLEQPVLVGEEEGEEGDEDHDGLLVEALVVEAVLVDTLPHRTRRRVTARARR